MPTWSFEAGHTAAEFSARHMMVTNVRGHFKNVHGTVTFDEADPCSGSVEVQIDARGLWTGEPERDAFELLSGATVGLLLSVLAGEEPREVGDLARGVEQDRERDAQTWHSGHQ